ncbi:MAG: hypothetical protein ACR2NC_03245 [Thermodesulfobacteriota bacterium]
MKHLVITLLIIAVMVFGGIFINTRSVECNDCKNGKPCEDTFDCGELGVCICWYSGEQESLTGTAGKNGICQLQSQ